MLEIRIQNLQIDRQRIQKAVDKSSRKPMVAALSAIAEQIEAGYQRRNERSRPGQSPSVHTISARMTLRNVQYHYDADTKTGIVGPVKLTGQKSLIVGDKPAPALLEKGGTIIVPEVSRDGRRWSRQTRRTVVSAGMQTRRRRVIVKPRPNVRPSLSRANSGGKIINPWMHAVRP